MNVMRNLIGVVMLLGLLPLGPRTQADEAGCVVISAGAETDTLTGSVQNVGQVVIGRASSRTMNLHAGALHCLRAGAPTIECVCGDFNGDNLVTLADFSVFSSCFGLNAPNDVCTVELWTCADLDQNGVVNIIDFSTFSVIFSATPDGVAPPDCLSVD